MMKLEHSILLGAIQGITEWLPISSSAQGILVMINYLGMSPKSAFHYIGILHFGTLLAVILKFRRDLRSMLLGKDNKLLAFLTVSTLASMISGSVSYFFLEDFLGHVTKNFVNLFIAVMLFITALLLYLEGKIKSPQLKELEDITYVEMLIVGLAQGFAILPGISRSGVTIATLLLLGVRAETSLKLSFLMSIPVVFGAIFVISLESSLYSLPIIAVVVGNLASFIFGYLTIDFLLMVSRRMRFDIFCMFFSLIIFLFFVLDSCYSKDYKLLFVNYIDDG